MKNFLKTTSMLFLILMISGILSQNVSAAAKLSKTSVSLYTGMTYTLKVSDAAQKPTFASSKKSIATVNSKTGKISAKKEGSCYIKVKVGKTVLKCKVKVTKSCELSSYFKSFSKFKNVVKGLRCATPSEEPVVYTGTLYTLSKNREGLSNFFIRTNSTKTKVTSLQNCTYKKYLLYGVRIGDTEKSVHAALKKHGFKLSKVYKNPERIKKIYLCKGQTVACWFENGKCDTYQWY